MKTKMLFMSSLITGSILLGSVLAGWMDNPAPGPELIEKSVTKSLLLLQKSGYTFTNNTRHKCASCHHNSLTSIAAGLAREKGIPVVDSFTTYRIKTTENTLREVGNPNLVNQFLNANFVAPYFLLALNAEKYPASIYTDMAVDYLISQATPDGSFLTESFRAPLEAGDVHLTAMAIRGIQLYASPAKKQHVSMLVARTRHWLENIQTQQQQELAFQLLGLHWCGAEKIHMAKVAKHLLSMQNEDGGWSQLPGMKSDAYATGQTLCALYESGMVTATSETYRKGLDYLLRTQDEEGAWFVATRSFPIQPFINSNFPPYDDNQFISATASNWAVMALLNALPDKK
jgi:prenyltransferase beta subunit